MLGYGDTEQSMKSVVILKICFSVLTLAFSVTLGTEKIVAQQREVWRSIVNRGGEFAAHIPPDMIVINEDRDYPRLILSSQDVRLDIIVRPNLGKKNIAITSPLRSSADSKLTTFELGEVSGRIGFSERPNRVATVINASSEKNQYFVAAYARVKDHPKVIRFLASIKFGGKPLLTIQNVEPESPGKATDIDDLESSEIVREFLKKPVNKKAEIRFESPDPTLQSAFGENGEARQSNANETRSLIILRMPKPAYTPYGGRVSGFVTVQVTLLSTGQIGTIVADPKLDRGLAESAVDAARQIKFIPATIEGKPVDVKRTFVYSFISR